MVTVQGSNNHRDWDFIATAKLPEPAKKGVSRQSSFGHNRSGNSSIFVKLQFTCVKEEVRDDLRP